MRHQQLRTRDICAKPACKYVIYFAWTLTYLVSTQVAAKNDFFLQQQPDDFRSRLPGYLTPSSSPRPFSPTPSSPDSEHDLRNRLSQQLRVYVRQFKLVGNTRFSKAELAEVTKPYEGKTNGITSEELQEVRYQLTLYYVNRGFINSGAVIPDQRISDGVIQINIIEGKLSKLEVEGNDWLHKDYIKGRLALDQDKVLNVQNLQQRLQLLKQNPLIDQINASLAPGIRPGESVLGVSIKEAKPYELGITVSNDLSPSVGGERIQFFGVHRNLTRWGDSLGLRYSRSLNGGDTETWYTFYSRPLNAQDTSMTLWLEDGESVVIEEPFKNLDIVSEVNTYGINVTHPLYQTPQGNFSLGLGFELRRSDTFLLDRRFSFSQGANQGESNLTVLSFSQDWLKRSLNQVLAARSVFRLGINAFDATKNDARPDGRFSSWLGQFQWARRFGERGFQVLFRSDAQLTGSSLLPQEQCSVGGATTVRGYRENLLVRDNCWINSLEFRIPVVRFPIPGISQGSEAGAIQLAPFVDYGRAWNNRGPTPRPLSISSVGIGLRWDPAPKIHTELYWGHAFRNVDQSDSDLQDDGVHFRVQVAYPW